MGGGPFSLIQFCMLGLKVKSERGTLCDNLDEFPR